MSRQSKSGSVLVAFRDKENNNELVFRYLSHPGSTYRKKKRLADTYGFETVEEFWDEVTSLAEDEEMDPWAFIRQGRFDEYYSKRK